MASILRVEAVRYAGDSSVFMELELPLGPYGLLDALERLRARNPGEVEAEVLEFHDFAFLRPVLWRPQELNQLNALAWRLSGLDRRQSAALQGLIQMEKDPVTLQRLWSLSCNVDSCHVVDEAMNDSQLGRFYAENGFVPEVEGVPDGAFGLLDFERIGREARLREGGIFTENGYVVRHEELRQIPFPVKTPPQRPEYIFRLTLGVRNAEAQVPLELPASRSEIQAALDQLGNPQPESLVVSDYDGAIPALPDRIDRFSGLYQLNELALAVQTVVERGELSKYNAVLEAAQWGDVYRMTEAAGRLDDYIFEPQKMTVEDVVRDEIRYAMGASEKGMSMLLRHLDLYGYGQDLLEDYNASLTGYGFIVRRDGQPIQTLESGGPQMGGMEVKM